MAKNYKVTIYNTDNPDNVEKYLVRLKNRIFKNYVMIEKIDRNEISHYFPWRSEASYNAMRKDYDCPPEFNKRYDLNYQEGLIRLNKVLVEKYEVLNKRLETMRMKEWEEMYGM